MRRAAVVAWDVGAWIFALLAFLLVRHDLSLSERVWQVAVAYTVAAIVLQVVGGFRFHLYLGRSKIGSFDEVTVLGALVAGISAVLGLAFFVSQPIFSRGLAVAMPSLAFLVMATGRWVLRAVTGRSQTVRTGAARALIYGAGDVGHQVARLVDTADDPPYRIVGFIDDDPSKRFLRVRGRRVLGVGADLDEVARSSGAEVLILAISQAQPRFIQALSDQCERSGLNLVVVPPVREMIAGQVELETLREFNVVDLLGRRPVTTDLTQVAEYVTGKIVLVTGAGGSIGSELARQVHQLNPARLVLLDRDESALHAVQLQLYGSGLLDRDDLVLCDIRDSEALEEAFSTHRPDVVFHAAALKHLPMLERYPEEGWKTNVIGSLNVLQQARAHGVGHFVNISTDKAADATSVLGQTKRLSERLTSWYAHDTGLPYISVRFGNVLGSRGSVLDAFRAQIDRGGPVTVTHPDVTRFFMTIPEACELVLQSGAIGQSGDVLVLDMGEPVRIVDVARRLIDESHTTVGIKYTGLRHGEKLHEVLLSGNEKATPSRHPLITQVSVPPLDPVEVLVDDAAIDHIGPLLRRQMSAGARPPQGEHGHRSERSW